MSADKNDPVLEQIMAGFPPEDRDDPKLREMVKGTFEYQRLTLVQAAREFGSEVGDAVEGQFKRLDERRNRMLRRWRKDPR